MNAYVEAALAFLLLLAFLVVPWAIAHFFLFKFTVWMGWTPNDAKPFDPPD